MYEIMWSVVLFKTYVNNVTPAQFIAVNPSVGIGTGYSSLLRVGCWDMYGCGASDSRPFKVVASKCRDVTPGMVVV